VLVVRSRGRGVLLLVAGCALVAGVIVIAFIPWGRGETLTTQEVAHASEVTATPIASSVRAQDGADRLLQRERTGYPCGGAPTMGCPLSVPVRMVPLFLIRDSGNTIRAFVGEDPRNGCKLLWRTDIHDGAFFDSCHGSFYNRDGRVIGGPSPWNLNEWAVEVTDDTVFVDPARIIPGGAPGFGRP
jgi:nitrite reductase/ring-hydroxylating ferredoxin subunit